MGGTCLRSQKPSGARVESNEATSLRRLRKKVSTLQGPAQLADLQGTRCVSAQYSYVMASSGPSKTAFCMTGGGTTHAHTAR